MTATSHVTQQESITSDSQDQKNALHKKVRQNKTKRVISLLLGIIIFFILTTLFSQYQVYVLQKIATAKEESHPDVPVTNDDIIKAVSRHVKLPEGTPQVAEVKDAAKLVNSQAFFKDAVNGDVVVVYQDLIILYRPTEDILINVGTIEGPLK